MTKEDFIKQYIDEHKWYQQCQASEDVIRTIFSAGYNSRQPEIDRLLQQLIDVKNHIKMCDTRCYMFSASMSLLNNIRNVEYEFK